jgi:hypothetical protein
LRLSGSRFGSHSIACGHRPHAGTDRRKALVWTNDDLARLHSLGLISIVGKIDQEKPSSAFLRTKYVKTQDPEWYAVQTAKLRDALQHRQARLHKYQQAIDDTRHLKKATGGLDLADEDFATTPEAGV